MKKEIERVVEWIRSFVKRAGAEGVVLGLSGGVDSAVVAALAAKALGSRKVFCLGMPCDSDPSDLVDAKKVSKHLDVQFEVVDLNQLYTDFLKAREFSTDKDECSSLACANLKARLRMATVYLEANDLNYLVIGTGNRSELLCGYVTKFGDGACDFEPLGNFYKTEVVEMARELGLPKKICNRTPSPGLQAGVTDESELGMPYSKLDPILRFIMSGVRYGDLGDSIGFSKDDYKRVAKMVRDSSHKRRMPLSCPRGVG